MTNLEKIKSVICEAINSMTEQELFEFISDYDENTPSYFPSQILFTCSKCHELYGNCEAYIKSSVNYSTCKNRFHNYCKLKYK